MLEPILILLGVFGATLLAIYLNSSVLKPVFSVDESSVERTYDPASVQWMYRLVVQNVGLRAAANCIGTMNIDSVQKEDVYDLTTIDGTKRAGGTLLRREHLFNTPTKLDDETIPWDLGMRGKEFSITINKTAKAKLLLFCLPIEIVSEGLPVLFIEPKQDHWDRVALIAHRNYEGEIKVTANNANPRTIRYVIETDGKKPVNLRILKVEPKTMGKLWRQFFFGQ